MLRKFLIISILSLFITHVRGYDMTKWVEKVISASGDKWREIYFVNTGEELQLYHVGSTQGNITEQQRARMVSLRGLPYMVAHIFDRTPTNDSRVIYHYINPSVVDHGPLLPGSSVNIDDIDFGSLDGLNQQMRNAAPPTVGKMNELKRT